MTNKQRIKGINLIRDAYKKIKKLFILYDGVDEADYESDQAYKIKCLCREIDELLTSLDSPFYDVEFKRERGM